MSIALSDDERKRRYEAVKRHREKNPGYDKEWRLKNLEKTRESARKSAAKRRTENPEVLYERTREWKLRNQDKVKAHRKAYYEKTKDKYLPLNNKWNTENKERSKEVSKLYRQNNVVKILLLNGARRAKTRGIKIVKEDISNWESKICGICNLLIEDKFHIDHKIPLAKGGLHVVDNLQLAHPLCNMRKRDKITIS